jgi:acetoin utilization deacetylase AcuC-like enzyme
MEAEMIPALRRFKPSLVIISAGFDAHMKDPIGGLRFTDDDFYWITRELIKVAEEFGEGRVVSILEGGYSMEGLATGTAAHVRALMED